jgi:predicted RNase H-like HicB family nuclease
MERKLNGAFDIAVNEEIVKGRKVFIAHCLNLGIASQGYSYEEAIENIKDAIKLYLEECPEKISKKQEELLPPIATRLFL